ncbi:hypothetical protein CBP51_06915 [Cellvibrio mixtus]|uniref:Uncharacterized protein n=1 Tax=Cellvibrio mixtus TaxID=39650 RepID=A0A266QA18_9GAMM|nr:hypothetical protein [Cellvibrio mixtus]OZY86737.1 hypothetical protein CBP51_06915 [Cellvibrio mixtus]
MGYSILFKRIVSLLLLVFFVSFVAYFLCFEKTLRVENNSASPMHANENTVLNRNKNSAVHSMDASLIKNESETWNPMGDAVSKREIVDWFASRGNFSFADPAAHNDYQQYDLDTLHKLGDQGDLRALDELANRTETIDQLKSILAKAAIYGSTAAITRMGTAIESEFWIGNMSAEQRKPYILEAMSFYEVAEQRGDWWGKINDGRSLLERYGVTLSDEDNFYIAKRSKEIYENFEKIRIEMGLGAFDNSVPDTVIKFYEEMLRPL